MTVRPFFIILALMKKLIALTSVLLFTGALLTVSNGSYGVTDNSPPTENPVYASPDFVLEFNHPEAACMEIGTIETIEGVEFSQSPTEILDDILNIRWNAMAVVDEAYSKQDYKSLVRLPSTYG